MSLQRPGQPERSIGLAALKTASRRLRRWPAASLDRRSARCRNPVRPGQGNAVQPNKETSFRSQSDILQNLTHTTTTDFRADKAQMPASYPPHLSATAPRGAGASAAEAAAGHW